MPLACLMAKPVDEDSNPVDEDSNPVDEAPNPVDEDPNPVDEDPNPVDEERSRLETPHLPLTNASHRKISLPKQLVEHKSSRCSLNSSPYAQQPAAP